MFVGECRCVKVDSVHRVNPFN